MSLARFGVTKPVPVNLLMAAVLIAGAFSVVNLRREFFPEMQPESASVRFTWPGATPEEIEKSLARKIEDKLADLEEVDTLTTTISEGGGGIVVEFREDVNDVYRATDEVQRAVDELTDLPDDVERIRVTEFEPTLPVIMVSAYGDADEEVLKRTIRQIRDELITLPGMGEITISGARDYEIRVDVHTEAMIEHGLSLPLITDTVRRWMADIPGGTVRSELGNISVRAIGARRDAREIENIIVRAMPDGSVLRLRDIAEVREYFVDEEVFRRFNGEAAVTLTVTKSGDQDIVLMAEMVRAYVDGRWGKAFEPRGFGRLSAVMRAGDDDEGAPTGEAAGGSLRRQAWLLGVRSPYPLPPEVSLDVHSDLARFVEGRLDLLTSNAFYGAILVFLTLLLFLNWRAAFWVGVGLTTALAGTLVLMQILDVTLNLLTMFGLILVLGLLVDDAIVVAENIQARHDRGEASLPAAIKGTEQVFWPVVATVLTSIVAFLPLSFIRGSIGDLLGALPLVVACALTMSLIESVLILPSHMGHSLVRRDRVKSDRKPSWPQRYERSRDYVILGVIVPAYARLLDLSLRYRYVSIATAVCVLTISLGLVAGGRVAYTFLESADSETIIVDVRLPVGSPASRTDEIVRRFEKAAVNQPETQSVSAIVGEVADIETGQAQTTAGHVAQLFIELKPVELRDQESSRVIASIREAVGPLPEVERVAYSEITGGPGGPDITIRVRGENQEQMLAAVADVKAMLDSFEGVFDIADDNTLGQREIQVALTPSGAALGFTMADVANQIRGAVFGLDAHVFAADREDIDVRVRLDQATRRDLHAVENLWLISPSGQPVPLTEIATLTEGTSYASIKRVDRQRAITVTADTAPEISPESIAARLDLAQLRQDYPLLTIETAGRQEQQADAFASLPIGFAAAMIMIYVILAWLFSSYLQPLVVMIAIPFGLIGVICGHLLLGFDLTFLSMIGFVALSGVIVNDSLILVQFYNACREGGMELREALVAAGRQRLRPIMLTTITTVLGLTPLMLERSFQARFLIPMAIAIACGLLGATIVILMVLPCLIVILDDMKAVGHFLWHGRTRPNLSQRAAAVAEPFDT